MKRELNKKLRFIALSAVAFVSLSLTSCTTLTRLIVESLEEPVDYEEYEDEKVAKKL